MKEITVLVGSKVNGQEKRFIGMPVGKWDGVDNERIWMLEAEVYLTQKKNWAVLLTQTGKVSLVTNPIKWIANGEFLGDPTRSELYVEETPAGFEGKLPAELITAIKEMEKKTVSPVEFLDI